VNWDEHEEEERNIHANNHDCREEDHVVDDHQEDNFWEDNHREQRNGRANRHGDRQEYGEDLSRNIAELERRCTKMDMERRTKANL
jgi:hypothetical protein